VPDRIVGTWSRGISGRSSSPSLPGCRRGEQWRIRVNEPRAPSIRGHRSQGPACPRRHTGSKRRTNRMDTADCGNHSRNDG
jgi:hypothetical protein